MTGNGVVVAAGGIAALVAWLGLGYPATVAIAVVCGGMLAVGLPTRVRRRSVVEFTLTCPVAEPTRGDQVIIAASATGRGVATLRIDALPGFTGAVAVTPAVPGSWTSPPLPRGRHTMSVAQVTDTDAVGLWRRRIPHAGGHTAITVWPRRTDLVLFPDNVTREQDGRPATSTAGAGAAFAGLREYHEGDDIRHIDWAASSRATDEILYVRHYAPSVADELLVVIDPYVMVQADPEEFETAVDLAWSFVRAGASLQVLGEESIQYTDATAGDVLLGLVPSVGVAPPVNSTAQNAVLITTTSRRHSLGPTFRISSGSIADDGCGPPWQVRTLAEARTAWARWTGT